MLYSEFITNLAKEWKACDEAKERNLGDRQLPKALVDVFVRIFVEQFQKLGADDSLRLMNRKGQMVGSFKNKLRKGRTYHVAKKGGGMQDIVKPDSHKLVWKQKAII